jgi:hypothetical protein
MKDLSSEKQVFNLKHVKDKVVQGKTVLLKMLDFNHLMFLEGASRQILQPHVKE